MPRIAVRVRLATGEVARLRPWLEIGRCGRSQPFWPTRPVSTRKSNTRIVVLERRGSGGYHQNCLVSSKFKFTLKKVTSFGTKGCASAPTKWKFQGRLQNHFDLQEAFWRGALIAGVRWSCYDRSTQFNILSVVGETFGVLESDLLRKMKCSGGVITLQFVSFL